MFEPVCARIEVNDNFLGVTPPWIELACDDEGKPEENVLIRAMQTSSGGYCQVKFLKPILKYDALLLDARNRLPEKIVFDMRLVSSYPTLF
jgi:hypothetical protein